VVLSGRGYEDVMGLDNCWPKETSFVLVGAKARASTSTSTVDEARKRIAACDHFMIVNWYLYCRYKIHFYVPTEVMFI
jgi:hypothetical protein